MAGWCVELRSVVSWTASPTAAPARRAMVARTWAARIASGSIAAVGKNREAAGSRAPVPHAAGKGASSAFPKVVAKSTRRAVRRASPTDAAPNSVRAPVVSSLMLPVRYTWVVLDHPPTQHSFEKEM